MNWKLICALSTFGLFMAVGGVFFLPPAVEPMLWLPIFIVCALLIARTVQGKVWLHGLLLGLANCVWITSFHVLFFERYAAGHPEEMQMSEGAPLPPRAMMMLVGPVVGLVSGAIIGMLALLARRFTKPTGR